MLFARFTRAIVVVETGPSRTLRQRSVPIIINGLIRVARGEWIQPLRVPVVSFALLQREAVRKCCYAIVTGAPAIVPQMGQRRDVASLCSVRVSFRFRRPLPQTQVTGTTGLAGFGGTVLAVALLKATALPAQGPSGGLGSFPPPTDHQTVTGSAVGQGQTQADSASSGWLIHPSDRGPQDL
jgi:hypothetical protein